MTTLRTIGTLLGNATPADLRDMYWTGITCVGAGMFGLFLAMILEQSA